MYSKYLTTKVDTYTIHIHYLGRGVYSIKVPQDVNDFTSL